MESKSVKVRWVAGERELCMFNARASVTRVSGANGARNPNNKGENMPHRQNVTSGLINSQDFRGHDGLTHLPPVVSFFHPLRSLRGFSLNDKPR